MIDKLRMFIALARERHFGRAAEACGVAQPSLSSAIRQLEEQLGVRLVHRGSRYQGLTPEGERVLIHALRIVGDVRALRDEMRMARSGLSGHVRLGVIPTALPVIAELTRPFLARHRNVTLSILSRTSADILSGIESLQLEAGVTYLDNEPLGRVARVALYAERYRFLCAPQSALAARKRVTWAEAAAEPLCLLTSGMQNRRIIDQLMNEAGAHPAPRLETDSLLVLVGHVMGGDWASVVPLRLAQMFAHDGRLVALPLEEPRASHIVGLIAAHRVPLTPVLAALFAEAERFHPAEA